MNGEFRVKSSHIIPLFQKAAALRNRFEQISIKWIPREENKEADSLTERAYNNALLEDPHFLDML
jgi:ribonuclease HI